MKGSEKRESGKRERARRGGVRAPIYFALEPPPVLGQLGSSATQLPEVESVEEDGKAEEHWRPQTNDERAGPGKV